MIKVHVKTPNGWTEIGKNGESIVGPPGESIKGDPGLDGIDGVANMEEVDKSIHSSLESHQTSFDHSLLHSPFLIGTKTLDEADIGDKKIPMFDLKSNTLVYREFPKFQPNPFRGGTPIPSQEGNSGKFLTTNGSDLSWSASPTFTSLTLSGLTTGRVVYTTTGGLLTNSANLLYDGSLQTNLAAGLGTTQVTTKGLLLTNTTAAAAGAQQISPALNWHGLGWKTNATAASQSVDFRAYVLPVQGAAAPTGIWKLQQSINGAAYADAWSVTSNGFINTNNTYGGQNTFDGPTAFTSAAVFSSNTFFTTISEGSVFFAGGSGLLTGDSTKLFFDNTTKHLRLNAGVFAGNEALLVAGDKISNGDVPSGASGVINYGQASGYETGSRTHSIRVYSYSTVGSRLALSETYSQSPDVTDDGRVLSSGNATSPGTSQNLGGSGYIATGQSIDYVIIAYKVYPSGNAYSALPATVNFTDTINDSSTPFAVDLSWSDDLSNPIDGYLVQATSDGGMTFSYTDVGNVTSFTDSNSWGVSGAAPASPTSTPDLYTIDWTWTQSTSPTGTGFTIVGYFMTDFSDGSTPTHNYDYNRSVADSVAPGFNDANSGWTAGTIDTIYYYDDAQVLRGDLDIYHGNLNMHLDAESGNITGVSTLSGTGSTISGFTWAGSTIGISVGGTNATSFISGRLDYFNGTSIASAAQLTYVNSGSSITHLLITASAASNKPLVLKGAVSQTANLFEVQNNAGTQIAAIRPSGAGTFNANINCVSGTLSFPDMTGYIGGYDGGADRAFFFSGIISGGSVTGYKPMFFDSSTFTLNTGSSTNALFVDASQRVGIGTLSPQSKLHVAGYNTTLYTARFGNFLLQPYSLNNEFLTENAYFDGSNWTRVDTGYASGFQFYNGQILLFGQGSGSGAIGGLTYPLKIDSTLSVALGGNVDYTGGSYTGAKMLVEGSSGNVGIGVLSSISARLHIISTTEQQRIGYDTSNYYKTTIDSVGNTTFDAVGTSPEFTFSDPVNVPDEAYGSGWNGNTEVPTKNAIYDKIETIASDVLADHFTDTTVGGGEADIYTFTTAASQLSANGQKIVAEYGGNFVTVGTELTQLKVYFSGTAIWDSTGVAPTTGTTSWRVWVEIIRVSSTVIRYTVSLNTTGASGFVYCAVGELTGLTLSGTNILKVTGQSSGVGSGSGDIVGRMGFVSFIPAA